jgi:hypothetical protein
VDGAGDAVRKVLAWGWLACAGMEAEAMAGSDYVIEVRAERTPEDLWDFWAPSSNQMLETTNVPPELAKQIRLAGSDIFVAELKRLGLTKFLGGSKLNQLGMRYAQAGWLLRVVQTSEVDDDRFQSVLAGVRSSTHRPWRFSNYPV